MFILQATVLKFVYLLVGWKLGTSAKFQHNISKIMSARLKKQGHGVWIPLVWNKISGAEGEILYINICNIAYMGHFHNIGPSLVQDLSNHWRYLNVYFYESIWWNLTERDK